MEVDKLHQEQIFDASLGHYLSLSKEALANEAGRLTALMDGQERALQRTRLSHEALLTVVMYSLGKDSYEV